MIEIVLLYYFIYMGYSMQFMVFKVMMKILILILEVLWVFIVVQIFYIRDVQMIIFFQGIQRYLEIVDRDSYGFLCL